MFGVGDLTDMPAIKALPNGRGAALNALRFSTPKLAGRQASAPHWQTSIDINFENCPLLARSDSKAAHFEWSGFINSENCPLLAGSDSKAAHFERSSFINLENRPLLAGRDSEAAQLKVQVRLYQHSHTILKPSFGFKDGESVSRGQA